MSVLKPVTKSVLLGLVAILAACGTSRGVDGVPIRQDSFVVEEPPFLLQAHSHNDYDQPQPLVEALGRGFASIEVDIVLQDGELYVAHGPDEVSQAITLQGAYLAPLSDIVANGGGTVYGAERPPLQLLVDVKTDAYETYAALHEVLREYSGMLTAWEAGRRSTGAVTVVISGNRPVGALEGATIRYASLDGRILDDREAVGPDLMPLVSEDWEKLGPPDTTMRLARARRVVDEMHAEGRRVRFWGTPEDEDLWQSLIAMGVDYIGTDQVDRLDRFLRTHAYQAGSAID